MPGADIPGVTSEHPRAASGRLRDGATCGLVAEAVILPAVVAVALLDRHDVRWAYVAGAVGTLVASLAFLLAVRHLTRPAGPPSADGDTWIVVACLVLVGLALIDLATASPAALAAPAILLGTAYVFLVGSRRDRALAAPVAVALLSTVAWSDGVRGAPLWCTVGAYTATLVAVAAICSHVSARRRTPTDPGADAGLVRLRQDLDTAVVGTPGPGDSHLDDILAAGLRAAGSLLGADRAVVVLTGDEVVGRSVLASWPDTTTPCGDLLASETVAGVLATHAVVADGAVCALPAGRSDHGALVLVASRPVAPAGAAGVGSVADRLSTELIRATSRLAGAHPAAPARRTDPLTGLSDLDALLERLDIEMHRALRADTALAVAVLDIDHLSIINEDHGPAAGDAVLRAMAAVLISNTRAQDAVGRIGGGQFCLVLPDTDLVGAQHLVESLRMGGRDATTTLATTVSAGITGWDGGEDPADLVARAHRALQRAKATGRNRIVTIAVADH